MAWKLTFGNSPLQLAESPAPLRPHLGLDTDTVELTMKTFLIKTYHHSRIRFSPNSLRTPYVRVEPYPRPSRIHPAWASVPYDQAVPAIYTCADDRSTRQMGGWVSI
eukprot:1195886-Prorocentrum_minimum.AAC.3